MPWKIYPQPVLAVLLSSLLAGSALAQSNGSGTPIALGAPEVAMPAGTPPSPSEHHLGPDAEPQAVWDITRATLLPFFSPSGAAGRTAVIILPGGGGRILSLQGSAALVHALDRAGIASFVLKYRTQPLDLTAEQFAAQMKADPRIPPAPVGQPRTRFEDINKEVNAPSPYRDMQVADLRQAIALVRTRSQSLGIDPARIIIVGQSNGGILVADYLEKKANGTPILAAGLLYGAPPRRIAPSDVPVYLAAALDDILTIDGTLGMFAGWKAAGFPAELHIYQTGGHGFRVNGSSGKASWENDFANWVTSLK